MHKKECKTCGHKKQTHCGCKEHSHNHDKRCKCNDKCNCRNNHSHNHCRKDLCSDDFRLRLGGLQNGLDFRLRQMIGCEVKIELENGEEVYGKICYVGSNFVELIVRDKETPISDQTTETDHKEEEETNATDKKSPHSKKCHTMIFPIDKINTLKLRCGCNRRCNC